VANESLCLDNFKDWLKYSPEDGHFRWIKRIAPKTRVGGIAGTIRKDGYVQLSLSGKHYLAHRLALLYMTGELPEEVDHINGNRADNRAKNLRKASRAENGSNIRAPKANNTSGYLGVTFSAKRSKWQAQITVNRKHMNLGLYNSPIEAHEAYVAAKRKLHAFCTI